jgi:hypothetical protein
MSSTHQRQLNTLKARKKLLLMPRNEDEQEAQKNFLENIKDEEVRRKIGSTKRN